MLSSSRAGHAPVRSYEWASWSEARLGWSCARAERHLAGVARAEHAGETTQAIMSEETWNSVGSTLQVISVRCRELGAAPDSRWQGLPAAELGLAMRIAEANYVKVHKTIRCTRQWRQAWLRPCGACRTWLTSRERERLSRRDSQGHQITPRIRGAASGNGARDRGLSWTDSVGG